MALASRRHRRPARLDWACHRTPDWGVAANVITYEVPEDLTWAARRGRLSHARDRPSLQHRILACVGRLTRGGADIVHAGLPVAGGAGGEGVGRARQPPDAQVREDAEAFYEVMARAALDAIGLPALLERVARAERKVRTTDEALKRERAMIGWATAEAENARLRAMIDDTCAERSSVTAHW